MSKAHAGTSFLRTPQDQLFKRHIEKYKDDFGRVWEMKKNPVFSHRTKSPRKEAERLRNHDDLVFFVGDRIYEILQQFVGQPLDIQATCVAVQQTLLSIENVQGIRLQTNVFLIIDERTRGIEVRFGQRGDLENLYGDLKYVQVFQIELPYERRKAILELQHGLPPIGGVPWRS